MAHGRPASRHGRYEAFRTGLAADTTADELPSQSVFSYDGTEDVRHARENPLIRRQGSARRRVGVTNGPVVAVHMFDMPADSYGKMSPTGDSISIRPHSGSSDKSYAPPSPHPPPSPRVGRPGSARRRSFREQRPPSSRRSSRDYTDKEEEVLPPVMATLRPQSSLGKYQVLPDIGLAPDANTATSRSDGSSADDQRGTEEVDSLVTKLAHKASLGGMQAESARHTHDKPYAVPQGSHAERNKDSQRTDTVSATSESSSGSAEVHIPRRRSSTRESSASSGSVPSPGFLERSRTSISHYKMDEAPQPTSDGQILLGIKIPTDGTRHKQYFNLRDQLRCIVLFAEEVSGEDFSNHILVLANPRQKFSNLSQTIEEAGIENKSVIHLEELD